MSQVSQVGYKPLFIYIYNVFCNAALILALLFVFGGDQSFKAYFKRA